MMAVRALLVKSQKRGSQPGHVSVNLEPLGLMHIAAFVRKFSAHAVAFIDAQAESPTIERSGNGLYRMGMPDGLLRERIRSHAPQVVGISALFEVQEPEVINVARVAKSVFPNVCVVVGGLDAGIRYREYLESGVVDLVVRGDGEETSLDILDHIDRGEPLTGIPGTCESVAGDGQRMNPPRVPGVPFDEYPYCPWPPRATIEPRVARSRPRNPVLVSISAGKRNGDGLPSGRPAAGSRPTDRRGGTPAPAVVVSRMSPALRILWLLLVLSPWASACSGPPIAHEPPANVIVLVVDTLRSDRLRCYGASRDTSPSIDAVATDGVLFENAFTAAPSTWQSFNSILTGLYPPHHGVRFIYDDPLPATVDSLASILTRAGYATAAFDVTDFMREMTGGNGFQEYIVGRGDAGVMDHLLTWIDTHRSTGPFFAFVRFIGPHWPYQPKQEFHDLFGSDEGMDHSFNVGSYGVDVGQDLHRYRIVDREARRRFVFEMSFPQAVIDHMILHYDAAVRTNDEVIGRGMAQLRAWGLLDQTVVVITADHGESFGERGYRGHGPRVDEVAMRVPLIFRFPPSAKHGQNGQRVAQLVRTVDIAPTVLDALARAAPPQLDGTSLLGAIDHGADFDLAAYGETDNDIMGVDPQRFLPGVAGKHRMMRTRGWKLVYIPDGKAGQYHLYDMSSRGEDEDVASAHPDVLATMRGRLDPIVAADPMDRVPGHRDAPLTDAQIEQLRALGYM